MTVKARQIKTGDVERRFVPLKEARVEIRAGSGSRAIGGLGIPVGVTADIGSFTEEVAPEAVEDLMGRGWDIRGLYNHDVNFVLGRTKSGTLRLRSTPAGLEYEVPSVPKTREDVLEAIRRGDVDGSSFGFTVADEEWEEGGVKSHRIIKRFGQVFDIGPVTFEAYQGHATVSTRAIEMAESFVRSESKVPERVRAWLETHPEFESKATLQRWLNGQDAPIKPRTHSDRTAALAKARKILEDEDIAARLRWRSAIHEAAHAVAATVLDLDLRLVELDPRGRVVADGGGEDRGTVALAGAAAVREILGDWDEPSSDDERQYKEAIEDRISPYGDGTQLREPYVGLRRQKYLQRAKWIIQQRRMAIEATARELSKRGRLTGAEVERIVNENTYRRSA